MTQNTAFSSGGAIYLEGNCKNISISDIYMSKNSASQEGGGMQIR